MFVSYQISKQILKINQLIKYMASMSFIFKTQSSSLILIKQFCLSKMQARWSFIQKLKFLNFQKYKCSCLNPIFISVDTNTIIGDRVMVFNVTYNNILVISLQSVLLVEETGVPGENHRPVESQ